MADWLRKLNANPLSSARVVSNTIFVILLIGGMVKPLHYGILTRLGMNIFDNVKLKYR